MKTTKQKITEVVSSWYFPFIALVLAVAVIHFIITPGTKDDAIYAGHLARYGSGLKYLISDYKAWSSRQIIESVLIYVIHFKTLWAVLDTLLFSLAAFSISLIAGTLKNARINRWICLLALIYPFADAGTAGWVVTSVYYIWTMSLCLVAIIPVAKIARGQRIAWWEYPLYAIALLFSGNIEPVTAVLLCVYGVFLIVAIKKKLPRGYLISQLAVLLAMLAYILTCPGNDLRHINEVAGQFPEFDMIPLWRKFEMGYSSTWYEYIMQPNFLFIAFAAIVACAVFALSKSKAARGVSLVPITAAVAFGLVANTNSFISPALSLIADKLGKFGTGIDFASFKTYIPDLIITAVFASIFIAFFAAFEKKTDAWICSLALLMGFGSRMAMSLSPTIWVSGSRTFIYMYFSFIVCAAMLLREWLGKKGEGKLAFGCGAIITATAVLSYLGTLYTIV